MGPYEMRVLVSLTCQLYTPYEVPTRTDKYSEPQSSLSNHLQDVDPELWIETLIMTDARCAVPSPRKPTTLGTNDQTIIYSTR